VLALAGWLALLIACLENDLGRTAAAEATRKGAILLGKEIGHNEILGWGIEIRAWMALTEGEYGSLIKVAQEGQAISGQHSVAVQLAAQEAKGRARIGDRTKTQHALDRGRRLLTTLEYPDNRRNHLQVDPNKYDFYAMDCYRLSGDNSLAVNAAENVVRASTSPDGNIHPPIRVADARLTQATVAALRGDLEQAVTVATMGLALDRTVHPIIDHGGVGTPARID
jgi:hypothetical protein